MSFEGHSPQRALAQLEAARASAAGPDSSRSQRIFRMIVDNPGIPLSELKRGTGSGWGALYHHLISLTRAGLIQTRVVGGRRLAFATISGAPAANAAEGRSLLCGRTARRVAEAISRRPYGSIAELCDELGDSPRAIYYHVRRLVQAGLVLSASPTRYADLAPTPLLESLLSQGEGPRRPRSEAAAEPAPLAR